MTELDHGRCKLLRLVRLLADLYEAKEYLQY